MYIMLDSTYVTMSISTGLYPNLDLWNANKLHYITLHIISYIRSHHITSYIISDHITSHHITCHIISHHFIYHIYHIISCHISYIISYHWCFGGMFSVSAINEHQRHWKKQNDKECVRKMYVAKLPAVDSCIM